MYKFQIWYCNVLYTLGFDLHKFAGYKHGSLFWAAMN